MSFQFSNKFVESVQKQNKNGNRRKQTVESALETQR